MTERKGLETSTLRRSEMTGSNIDLTLERDAREFANDPEFIAEGLSIKVIEEMLKLMEERGLNQSWLAEKMGVSRAHVSRMLNAPPNMTLLTVAKIAVALGVTPDVSLNVGDKSAKSSEQEMLAEIQNHLAHKITRGHILVKQKAASISEPPKSRYKGRGSPGKRK